MATERPLSAERQKALAALGTLAHNRRFTRREALEYGITERAWRWLVASSIIECVAGAEWFPTPTGWAAIEAACLTAVSHGD